MAGVLLVRLIIRFLRTAVVHIPIKPAWQKTMVALVNVLLYAVVFATTAGLVGYKIENAFKLLIVLTLVAVTAVLMFRPYIPSLPFKEGDTVKSGSFLGKIEAVTFLNTRMRTFDGKTVWIPNTKIGKDYLINYHYTPTRRIYLDVRINYDQDLLHAKQTLEAVMIADARVLKTPRPVVYVTNLLPDSVALGGRCWVDNLKYWTTRCDLLEKIKLRFDHESIAFAYPQQLLHIRHVDLPQKAPAGERVVVDRSGEAT